MLPASGQGQTRDQGFAIESATEAGAFRRPAGKIGLGSCPCATYRQRLVNTGFRCGSDASLGVHRLRAGSPPMRAAHAAASSRPGQASSPNTLGQLRPWVVRGSGKMSRRYERFSVPITESYCKESARRKPARQLSRYMPAVSRACRSGNRRHHEPMALGPSHGRVGCRASIWTHSGHRPMHPTISARRTIARRGHTRGADANSRRRRRSSHKAQ